MLGFAFSDTLEDSLWGIGREGFLESHCTVGRSGIGLYEGQRHLVLQEPTNPWVQSWAQTAGFPILWL